MDRAINPVRARNLKLEHFGFVTVPRIDHEAKVYPIQYRRRENVGIVYQNIKILDVQKGKHFVSIDVAHKELVDNIQNIENRARVVFPKLSTIVEEVESTEYGTVPIVQLFITHDGNKMKSVIARKPGDYIRTIIDLYQFLSVNSNRDAEFDIMVRPESIVDNNGTYMMRLQTLEMQKSKI